MPRGVDHQVSVHGAQTDSSRSARQVGPDVALPEFGRVSPDAGLIRMGADAGRQVESPVMPRAGNDAILYVTAGQVAARVRAGIVEHHDLIANQKDSQLEPAPFDERAPVRPAPRGSD